MIESNITPDTVTQPIMLLTLLERSSGRILTATQNIIKESFRDFPQSLMSNTGIIREGSFR